MSTIVPRAPSWPYPVNGSNSTLVSRACRGTCGLPACSGPSERVTAALLTAVGLEAIALFGGCLLGGLLHGRGELLVVLWPQAVFAVRELAVRTLGSGAERARSATELLNEWVWSPLALVAEGDQVEASCVLNARGDLPPVQHS